MAAFAYFPAKGDTGYEMSLLEFSTMEEGGSFSADGHVNVMNFVLETFKKGWENVYHLIEDNCNTNKVAARKSNAPMMGGTQHRFNLAMKLMFREENVIIQNVHAIMGKLKTLTLTATLVYVCSLRTFSKNATR